MGTTTAEGQGSWVMRGTTRNSLTVGYRDERGAGHLVAADDAVSVDFERGRPVRAIPSYRGQAHTPGRYWAATSKVLLEYESFLECQWLTLLDFDPSVMALATQILELHGRDGDGSWRHVPDIWVRRADGSVHVVDVKNPRHLDRQDVRRQAARTQAACRRLGWEHALVGAPEQPKAANVAWLAGYRRPLRAGREMVPLLLKAARRPVPLEELARAARPMELARPVLFHLLWQGQLMCDLNAPLAASTLVVRAAVAR
jgi:hypothetical protein